MSKTSDRFLYPQPAGLTITVSKPETKPEVAVPKKLQRIVAVGNPIEGYDFYGPFPDKESAEAWVLHRGLVGTNSPTVAVLYGPEDN